MHFWWNKESEILKSHLKCFSLEKHIGVRRKDRQISSLSQVIKYFKRKTSQARNQVISKAYVQIQQQVVAQVKNFTAIHKNPRIAPSFQLINAHIIINLIINPYNGD